MQYTESGEAEVARQALFDRALLEVVAARETLFAIGDGALIELADALLFTLGQVAAKARVATAAPAGLPRAA